jgi:hypothetical protein
MSVSENTFLMMLPVALLAGCANYATLQEVDTMPKGHSKTGVGVTGTSYKVDAGDKLDSVAVPAVNVWYRRGLTDNLEAHAAAWIPLGGSAGVKYQLAGNRTTAGPSLSLGVDFGFLQMSTTDDMDNTSKQTVVDTYVPVYLGYRTGPGFALYASPKYILRTSTGDAGTALGHLAGGTVGLAIGARTQFLLEGTVIYDISLRAPAFQGGIGVAF